MKRSYAYRLPDFVTKLAPDDDWLIMNKAPVPGYQYPLPVAEHIGTITSRNSGSVAK